MNKYYMIEMENKEYKLLKYSVLRYHTPNVILEPQYFI